MGGKAKKTNFSMALSELVVSNEKKIQLVALVACLKREKKKNP